MSADAGLRGAPGAGAPAPAPAAGPPQAPARARLPGRPGAFGASSATSTATGPVAAVARGLALFFGGFTLVGVFASWRHETLDFNIWWVALPVGGWIAPRRPARARRRRAASPTPSRRACARGGAGRPSPCASSSPPSPPGTAWTSTSPGAPGELRPGPAGPALVRRLRPARLRRLGRAPAAGAAAPAAPRGRRPRRRHRRLRPRSSRSPRCSSSARRTTGGRPTWSSSSAPRSTRTGSASTSLRDRMTTAIEPLQGGPGQARPRVRRGRRQRLQRGARHARHGRGGRRPEAGRDRRLERREHQATVADTVPFFGEEGWTRILAVSQFYHLPRDQAGLPAGRLERVHGAGRHLVADPADAAVRGARDPGLLGVLPGGGLPLTGATVCRGARRAAGAVGRSTTTKGRGASRRPGPSCLLCVGW